MSDNNRKSRGLLGFLIGGAIGTVVGLLVAPERGEKLRRRVAYQLDHFADRVGDIILQYGKLPNDSEARKNADALRTDAELRAEKISQDMDAVLVSARQKRKSPSKEATDASS